RSKGARYVSSRSLLAGPVSGYTRQPIRNGAFQMALSAERHYTGELGREYHEGKRAIPERAARWVTALRAKKLQPLIAETDTVFEFGAGFGWNLLGLTCARKVAFD